MFFRTSPVERPHEHLLWEDSIVLIDADSEEDAELKARALAKEREIEYENAEGQMVTTKFDCIASVFQIDDELKGGCEIFSGF